MKFYAKDLEQLFKNNPSINDQVDAYGSQECICSLNFSKTDSSGCRFSLSFPYMEPYGKLHLYPPGDPDQLFIFEFCSDGRANCDPAENLLSIKLKQISWFLEAKFEPNIFIQIIEREAAGALPIIAHYNFNDLNQLLGEPEIRAFEGSFCADLEYFYYKKCDTLGYELILKIQKFGSECSITLLAPKANANTKAPRIVNIEFDYVNNITCDLQAKKLKIHKHGSFTPVVINLEPRFSIMVFDCEGCQIIRLG